MAESRRSRERSTGKEGSYSPRKGCRESRGRPSRTRTKEEASKVAGACSLLIGGLPDGMPPPYFQTGETEASTSDLPRGAVTLPDTPPHPSQLEALDLIREHRRAVLVAGRRWGKTSLLVMLAINGALAGRSVGVFCPTYKFLGPLFEPIVSALRALPGVRVNRMLGEIRLVGGGAIYRLLVARLHRARRPRAAVSFGADR